MSGTRVTFVRVYLTEGEHTKDKIFRRLHDEEKVRGVTVFRGISGFGRSGQVHSSSLLDVSLDLPLVIEFFDEPETVLAVIERLRDLVEPDHVLTYAAEIR